MDGPEEDPYPNFSHAFPSNTSISPAAAEASWNPALRQNSNTDSEEDDFFDRYPGATPKKDAEAVGGLGRIQEAQQVSESPLRRQSISVEQSVDVRESYTSPEELQRVPSSHVEVEGLMSPGKDEEADDETPVLGPGDSMEEQEIALEERMPEDISQEIMQDEEGGVQEMDRAMGDAPERPEDHYEHQGEVTELDSAQEPPEAPLMANEELLPTPGEASREPTFPSRESTAGFDGTPAPRQPESKAQPVQPQLDRSFTTNFSDSPIESTSGQPRSIPDDWPSMGDDRTFGEILDNQQSSNTKRHALQEVAAKESEQEVAPDMDLDLLPDDAGEVSAEGWGALDDDDDELLEETPTGFDPSQAFGGDDDGFLEDELLAPASMHLQQAQPSQQQQRQPQQQEPQPAPTTQYRPANFQQTPSQPQQPGIPSPQFFQQGGHGRSADTPLTGLPNNIYAANQVGASHQLPQQRPTILQQQGSAQSFADKSKGGYQSPYDLPMEVVKPRRRPQQQPTPAQTPISTQQHPGPPPRTSSIGSPIGPPPPLQQAPAAPPGKPPSAASLSPPPSRGSGGSAGGALAGAKSTPKSTSGFFEDLPDVAAKPRSRPAAGAYTPQARGAQGMPTPPPQAPAVSMSPPKVPHGGRQVPLQQPSQQPPASFRDFRQPDRLPLLPDQPAPQPQQQPPAYPPAPSGRYSPNSQQSNLPAPTHPPPSQTRYSPAPAPTATTQAPPATKYSPAPTSQPQQAKPRNPSVPANAPGLQQVNAFAPRTSSPLAAAQTDKTHPSLPPEAAATRGMSPSSPPKGSNYRQGSLSSESKYSAHSPMDTRAIEPSQQFGPPLPRPRTQSPDATMKGPRTARPTSAGGNAYTQPQLSGAPRPKGPVLPHRRQFSRELSFARPQDERSEDPLERWRGHPIFKWSASGTVLSTFPKQTPFYSTGSSGLPSVKCTPGAITVQDSSTFLPMDDRTARFPGPLTARSKGKKKDVLAWMTGKIEELERAAEGVMLDFALPGAAKKRTEEKVVLWKLVRVLVEHEGVLEGNARVEEEVRRVLLPILAQMAQLAELHSPASAVLVPDAVDKQVLFQMRQALLEGERERAVWLAEERKLWGHAMLIASTMGPETWKQIIQAFVRSQVKSVGSDARSMAALYQVFAGNSEECVDELVPPSARAGFQMISKADGSVSGNPLEGLDQWRETLGLVTSNRTATDGQSLISLGKLLASYGRVEAAHSCYLFARALVKQSGADDADAHFVLLGANHQSTEESFGSDMDSILLTEVYEYATSFAAPSTGVAYLPHLQPFKLMHAQELAAYGLKSNAQSYCDTITSAYTSTTRPSPYYHPTFTQAVTDLSAFLSQTPHDGKSGFFARPAMKTVSSGAASWFTKFVAGEDDQESTGSGGPGGPGSEGRGGPFGGVNGDSPGLSRTGSGSDLYGAMMGGGGGGGGSPSGGIPIPGMQTGTPGTQAFAPSSAPTPGRYAPGGQGGSKYAHGQPYSGLGMPAAEPQRPSSSRYAPPPSNSHSLGVPRPDAMRRASEHSLPYAPSSRRGSAQDTSSQGSYEPRPILVDESSAYSYSPSVQSPLVQAQHAPEVQEPEEDAFGGPPPQPLDAGDGGIDSETGSGYEPPTGGYEPPSYSYQPYEPDPESPEEPKSKKKTFGDDEDEGEMEKRATAPKKAQADREADELFKKAAEADAARDNNKAGGGSKKGWFGGWWGGSSSGSGGNRDATASPAGPIKAKLGEENSFYYDENLKKWVNKKGGPEASTPVAATPPPPKGPASRVASAGGTMGPPPPAAPPSAPPLSQSRASSTSGLASMARPPTSGSGPGFSGGPPSGPPSRSGTPASQPSSDAGLVPPTSLANVNVNGDAGRPTSSLSNASSIDDLLAQGPGGAAGARKGGTVKGKKKGRYVDVMAQ